METLVCQNSVELTYEVRGSGPGLVLPMLNFPWLGLSYVDIFAKDFTVVVASPRGYGLLTRLPEGSHDGRHLVDDVLAICDHVGLNTFALLGYSFSSAVSTWLVDRLPCPLYAFWGSADETISWLMDPAELEQRLRALGATVSTIPGLSHEATGFAIAPLILEVTGWLQRAASTTS